jgi:hypothetical protein
VKGFTKEFSITVKMYETVTHSNIDCDEKDVQDLWGFENL